MFYLPIPSKLANTWFGSCEVSRASAAAIIGDKLGIALGFLITPLFMPNDCSDLDLVRYGRSTVAYIFAGCNAAVFLLVLLGFQDKPPSPPSPAEMSKADCFVDLKKSFIRVMRNPNFLLLVLCRGLVLGLFYAFSTVLNEEILPRFPDSVKEIGYMGLTFVCFGLLGLYVAGNAMDITHKFKETSVAACALSFLAMVAFSGALFQNRLWVIFVVISIFGFASISYHVIGFEFAVELTYPEPEEITGGILEASSMIAAIPLTLVGSHLLQVYGHIATNLLFCCFLLLTVICSVMIKPEMRRTDKNSLEVEKNVNL